MHSNRYIIQELARQRLAETQAASRRWARGARAKT